MKMTLAKALKYKKRLVQSIAKVDVKMARSNSVLEGNPRENTMAELMKERKILVEHLVSLKTTLYQANFPIQDKIFRISELKGLIQQISALDTKDGKQEAFYRDVNPPVYHAEMKQGDVEEFVSTCEAEIDKLQEELDKYNYTTDVEIEDMKQCCGGGCGCK